jgi:hypothetical protein
LFETVGQISPSTPLEPLAKPALCLPPFDGQPPLPFPSSATRHASLCRPACLDGSARRSCTDQARAPCQPQGGTSQGPVVSPPSHCCQLGVEPRPATSAQKWVASRCTRPVAELRARSTRSATSLARARTASSARPCIARPARKWVSNLFSTCDVLIVCFPGRHQEDRAAGIHHVCVSTVARVSKAS